MYGIPNIFQSESTFTLHRQSYDVEISIGIDGTNVESRNTLDLKNPYFRYTGSQAPAPAGSNTVSPTDLYWSMASSNSGVNMVTENGLDGSCGNVMGASLVVNSAGAYNSGTDDGQLLFSSFSLSVHFLDY